MAWEKRGGKLYYYRSIRDGEQIRKEYVGSGEIAEVLARGDELIRHKQAEVRDREREEVERFEALAAPVVELSDISEVLVRAYLVAGGFHRHKGEWRRERNT
jgi:hypothetical protein